MYQETNVQTRIQTSAHLAQTMTILGMTSEEIREKVEGELSINPFLERIEERICPTCHRKLSENGKCPYCSAPKGDAPNENVVFISPWDEYRGQGYSSKADTYHDQENIDSAEGEELPTYVLRQIAPDLQDETSRMVAAHLLTSLDEDGFITSDLFEIAQYYRILPSKIEEIISLIQHADPLGVGSRDYKEALQVQIRHISDYIHIPRYTSEIINEHFEDLTHGHYSEIAKDYNISQTEVKRVEKFIGDNLNPFPARAHWGEIRHGQKKGELNAFHDPDILISYRDDDPANPLVVEVISPVWGYLQVNQLLKKEMKQNTDDKSEEWHQDYDKANLLVKSIYQRNQTISELMKYLITYQEDFIRNGDESLHPITRAEVSKALDVHESTISRAVSNKTVMLPNRRVIPLAAFFDRSLNVRTALKEIIKDETKPLTDEQIAAELRNRGFDVARRTVAKYRLMEGIGSTHARAAARRKDTH